MRRLLVLICLVSLFLGSWSLDLDSPKSDVPLPKPGAKEDERTFAEIAEANGYLAQTHTVTTKDGYILTIFNMTSKECSQLKSTPAFLMHGLLQSADSFLDVGKDGYPYLLADDCYNVWAGNVRGNYYGREHKTLSPDMKKFWKFSTDEMALYDVPAQIDYVLQQTGSDNVNYIGYSQGARLILMTCSESLEYNKKMKVIIALSPCTRLLCTESPFFRLLLDGALVLDEFAAVPGIQETFSRGAPIQVTLETICKMKIPLNITDVVAYAACDGLLNLLDPYHVGGIDDDTLKKVYEHFPAGTSTRTLSQYGQDTNSKNLPKFDFGPAGNLAKYKTVKPPLYNLSAVTAPVVINYSKNDRLVAKEDIFWVKGQLPNVVDIVEIADDKWVHFDNIYNKKLRLMIYPTITEWCN